MRRPPAVLGLAAILAASLQASAEAAGATRLHPRAQVGPGPAEAGAERAAVRPARVTEGRAGVEAANRAALHEPSGAGYLNAAQVYPWSEGALYRLYAAPGHVSDIALEPGEALVSVAAGDTARWMVGDTASGAGPGRRVHILVKPVAAGLSTNLIIATDRRVYHLRLESQARSAMAAVSWSYSQDRLVAIEAGAASPEERLSAGPEALRFSYRISGDDPDWRPLRAYDDGRQVYIEFPAAMEWSEAPPLFVTGDEGKPELVNYRLKGRHYIVDRLFGKAELRLGGKRQRVVRITRIDPAETK